MTAYRQSALLVVVVTVACAGLNAWSTIWAVQAATAIPLVLFLPGAAIVLALDPVFAHQAGSARLFWSWVGSLTVSIAGGLILNVTAGLDRDTWLAYLVGVVALGAVLSMVRRDQAKPRPVIWLSRLTEIRMSRPSVIFAVGAVILFIGAVATSAYSASTADQEHFVQLWIVPKPASAGSTAFRAEVGITNYEGKRERFDVAIDEVGIKVLARVTVELRQGQTWNYNLRRSALVPVTARVSLASRRGRTLDSVELAAPVH